MTVYEYRCRTCRDTLLSTTHHDVPVTMFCPTCLSKQPFGRKFSISVMPVMQEHFNHSVGQPVHSRRQHADLLKAKSAELYAQTGIETNYVPIDLADAKAVGATGEGIDASNRVRSKQGLPLLPEVK